MNLQALKSELRDLIANGNKLPSVFERLNTVLSESSDFKRFVTIRQSNLAKLKNDFLAGVISDIDYRGLLKTQSFQCLDNEPLTYI